MGTKIPYLSDIIHFLLFSLKENDVQVHAFRCIQILAQDSEPLTFLNVRSFLYPSGKLFWIWKNRIHRICVLMIRNLRVQSKRDNTLNPSSLSNSALYWMQSSSSSPPLQSGSPSQTYLLKMQLSSFQQLNCSFPPLQLLGDVLLSAEYGWMSKKSVQISFKSVSSLIHVDGVSFGSFLL